VNRTHLIVAAAGLPALLLAACGGPPARGATPAAPSPVAAPSPARAAYAPADAAFMQRMIAHHRQALEMTALVPARAEGAIVERLAGRIEASQVAEIDQMRRWLEARGAPVPRPGGHDDHDAAEHGGAMPGMLTGEEMERLAAASGADFDRLFLTLMIRHHEGALAMVADLFATEGAGQEPDVFRLASDVDADQRAEIARMQQVLTTLAEESP
jgi:uncharacterized protein (DUF305 family)